MREDPDDFYVQTGLVTRRMEYDLLALSSSSDPSYPAQLEALRRRRANLEAFRELEIELEQKLKEDADGDTAE